MEKKRERVRERERELVRRVGMGRRGRGSGRKSWWSEQEDVHEYCLSIA